MTQLQEFNQYLESRVGKSPYVWGAQGQKFKSYAELYAFIERHESGNDQKRALAYARKLESAGVPIEDVQVFDCSGLGMYWLQNVKKIYKYDMSANSIYGKCTPIKKTQLRVGDRVFRGGTGRKYHIGYVTEIRNGIPYVIESKGRSDGTVKRQINASGSTYWNAFGRPNEFKSEIEGDTGTNYTRLLKYKIPYMKGSNVLAVQSKLTSLGFDTKGADGVFGSNTKKAVIAYQKQNGLEADGIVGIQTWTKLFSNSSVTKPVEPTKPTPTPTPTVQYSRLLKVTSPYIRGDDVKAVQTALKAAGYDPKGIDGVYGENTESAVKAFQKAKKIEVDGIVGKITWGKLIG